MLEQKKIPQMQVSKWIKIPLLLDASEMHHLIQSIPSFTVYDVQRMTGEGEGIHEPAVFLDVYRRYIEQLKSGKIPDLTEFRPFFSSAWSVDPEAIFSIAAASGKRLLKPHLPIVQLQLNQIRYSSDEQAFLTQVYSADSITWGIMIGFPHLFMDPTSYEAQKTRDFSNMALFGAIQKWVRAHTIPTPFVIEGKKHNSSIRLGKACLGWIAQHPQLKERGISIEGAQL